MESTNECSLERSFVIPYTCGSYRITSDGVVYKNGVVLPKQEYVTIDQGMLTGKWPVEYLVCFTFKTPMLDQIWWSKISVGNITDDELKPSNLFWIFPPAMAVEHFNGFTPIPNFSKYLINSDGCVISRATGNQVPIACYKKYVTLNLMSDSGRRMTVKRHRLVASAFLQVDRNFPFFEVNHIDGIPGNDWVSNLEIVTSGQNSQHAVLNRLTRFNKPILYTDRESGEEIVFVTTKEFLEYFGLNKKHVVHCLKNGNREYVLKSGYAKYLEPEHGFVGSVNKRPLLGYAVKESKEYSFDTLAAAIKKTGLSKDVIESRLLKFGRLYEDGWLFKEKTDNRDWVIPTDFELELMKSSWQKKIVVLLEDGTVLNFDSQRDFAEEFDLSEATVTNWVSSDDPEKIRKCKRGGLLSIKTAHSSKSFPHVNDFQKLYRMKSVEKRVLVCEPSTGTQKIFLSAKECAREYNLLPTTLNWRLKSPKKNIYPPGVTFEYAPDDV